VKTAAKKSSDSMRVRGERAHPLGSDPAPVAAMLAAFALQHPGAAGTGAAGEAGVNKKKIAGPRSNYIYEK